VTLLGLVLATGTGYGILQNKIDEHDDRIKRLTVEALQAARERMTRPEHDTDLARINARIDRFEEMIRPQNAPCYQLDLQSDDPMSIFSASAMGGCR